MIQKIWILSFLSITKSLEKDWNSFLYVYLNTNNIHLNFMWEINFFLKNFNFSQIFFEKSWNSGRCIFMSFEVTAMILLWKERKWAIFFESKVFYTLLVFYPPFFSMLCIKWMVKFPFFEACQSFPRKKGVKN